jgi:hypothetical protein
MAKFEEVPLPTSTVEATIGSKIKMMVQKKMKLDPQADRRYLCLQEMKVF